jgi:outer membrane protein TolC
MNGQHDVEGPRPEFRAHLEWQIATALRREQRFIEPVTRRTVTRFGSALALLAAMAIGAVGATASGELQESRERDALVTAVRSEENVARLRLELARSAFEDARRRVEVGTASRDTMLSAEVEVQAMEAALKRLALDVEEIQATAKAPRNDLDAPMVGERDFVSERLKLQLAAAQTGLVAAERQLAEAQRRFEVGVASTVARLQAQADVMEARVRLEQLRDTIDLRQRAAAGALKSAEIAAAVRRLELSARHKLVAEQVTVARARIEEVRKRVGVGQATELELKRAEVELLERELEMKALQQEMEKLAAIRR